MTIPESKEVEVSPSELGTSLRGLRLCERNAERMGLWEPEWDREALARACICSITSAERPGGPNQTGLPIDELALLLDAAAEIAAVNTSGALEHEPAGQLRRLNQANCPSTSSRCSSMLQPSRRGERQRRPRA